jgi:hypothetical protein
MRDNPAVVPADVAVGFWRKQIAPGNMPVVAARLLAGGYDSAALRVAGGLAARGDPRSFGSAFQGPWWTLAAGSPAARLPVPGSAVGAE